MKPCPQCRGNRRIVRLHPQIAIINPQWKTRAGIGFVHVHCPACGGEGTLEPEACDPAFLEPKEPHPRLVGSAAANAVKGEIAA